MKLTERSDVRSNEMNGLFPHFVVAQTVGGHWAGFKLTTAGYRRITTTRYSPADASDALTEWLKLNYDDALAHGWTEE